MGIPFEFRPIFFFAGVAYEADYSWKPEPASGNDYPPQPTCSRILVHAGLIHRVGFQEQYARTHRGSVQELDRPMLPDCKIWWRGRSVGTKKSALDIQPISARIFARTSANSPGDIAPFA
jgi:hypothetical protein